MVPTPLVVALEDFLAENAIEEKPEIVEKPEKKGFFLAISLFFGPIPRFSKRKTKKMLQKPPVFLVSNTSLLGRNDPRHVPQSHASSQREHRLIGWTMI
jgi:hypothetical protein